MADILSAYSAEVERATAELNRVKEEIAKVIVGQTDVIEGVLICLIAGGHVLLEGVPGLGKTTLLRTLSRVLDLRLIGACRSVELFDQRALIVDLLLRAGKPVLAKLVVALHARRATSCGVSHRRS